VIQRLNNLHTPAARNQSV
jgi:hypothetical protein